MNHGSPLTRDQRPKKEEAPKKVGPKISLGATRKILKPLGIEVGGAERDWVDRWVENQVRGTCLPLSLYSSEFLSELGRVFGDGGADFQKRLLDDFRRCFPTREYTQ